MAEKEEKKENSVGGIFVAVAGLAGTALSLLLGDPTWVAYLLCLMVIFTSVAWYQAAKSEGNIDNGIALILTGFLVVVMFLTITRNSEGVELAQTKEDLEMTQKRLEVAIDIATFEESKKAKDLEERASARKRVEEAISEAAFGKKEETVQKADINGELENSD